MKHYFFISYIIRLILPWLLLPLFCSCFTGVESTKKITLSKEDRKAIRNSEEDLFLSSVKGAPLTEWEKGRPFYVADNRAILIFDQQGLPPDPEATALGGTTLLFEGIENRINLAGKSSVCLVFSTPDGERFVYNTGKTPEEAREGIKSNDIPMLIDLVMIQEAAGLLGGKKLWTRTSLWYDREGNRIKGKKFVPVTVSDIGPGSMIFPLKVGFADENGNYAAVFLNFGNSGTDSRSFSHIFYLDDIRKKFPSISNEVWELICNEKIRKGMTKEECKLSLGNPSEVSAGHDYSQTLDLWHYPDGSVLWFEDGLLSRFRK